MVTEQLRAYVVRASESLQHVPQQPCFPSHTSSQNHPLPPLSPFPFACMRSAIPTDWSSGLPTDCRSVCPPCEPECRGSARPCRSTLDCRSEASEPRAALRRSKSARRRAPRPASGPPMRAIAGACTVTMATVRPNPPGRQRTFSCQKRRTLRGSDGFAPTTPIRSSTAAAPCSFALSLKPTGGHAE